jgi:hypothetical protein
MLFYLNEGTNNIVIKNRRYYKMLKKKTDNGIETKATKEQIKSWQTLYKLFEKTPLPDLDLFANLGLYMKTSALAKILFLNELYQEIMTVPGDIVEFGTWWGQNVVVFENLRAIYEPFNKNRHIIGFDSYAGYQNLTKKDVTSKMINSGNFSTTKNYKSYLEKLVDFHEKNNVLNNIKKHQLIQGDVSETAPKYFKKNQGSIIALAYFDIALYEPTKICLNAIKDHLIPGSIIMLDELNEPASPGETIAFKEELKDIEFEIKKSKIIADRTILKIKNI